jgi:hypothetical protein
MKKDMKYKLVNQDELDQFIKDNNVVVERSNIEKQLREIEKIPDIARVLKTGVKIFLVCNDPVAVKGFIAKMAENA